VEWNSLPDSASFACASASDEQGGEGGKDKFIGSKEGRARERETFGNVNGKQTRLTAKEGEERRTGKRS